MIDLDKFIQFTKSFSHSVNWVGYNEYAIEYGKAIYLALNLDFNTITLRFYPKEHKMDSKMLSSLTRKINSEFILEKRIRERSSYGNDISWRTVKYKFIINKMEDLNKVIDILDQYFLMSKLSS